MKILVPLKVIPDPEARVKAKGSKEVEIEERYILNYFDEMAVEEALRIREKSPGSSVTLVSVGEKRAVEGLRRGIAMGADRAVLVEDPLIYSFDNMVVSRVLAAFARKEDFDLILCGREAMDDASGIVGPALAGFLGIPHVPYVVEVRVEEGAGTLKAKRMMEGVEEDVECPFPLLLTTQKGLNEPRIPLVMDVMKAMKFEIEKVDLEALGMDPAGLKSAIRMERLGDAPKRPPVTFIEGDFPGNLEKLVEILKDKGGLA